MSFPGLALQCEESNPESFISINKCYHDLIRHLTACRDRFAKVDSNFMNKIGPVCMPMRVAEQINASSAQGMFSYPTP